ncbi:3 protein [Persimmon virus A]|uniref:Movement protein BC1 n=1 Tax=Persimmon virus A TaxID=1211480 RepID=R4WAK7_9RHAB|nr:3 protein [Persimmon virus A]BAM36032.1 3 protein [Persimmon virus A]
MTSFVSTFKGELNADYTQQVVKLSKKLPILQSLWISAGFDNVSITKLAFSYKSRCPKAATGVVEITIRDLRLEDADKQEVAFVTFNVKDWVELSWSYPVWFHCTDFNGKHESVLDMCLDVVDTNMSEQFSLGSYKMKIYYRVQNQITKFRPSINRAYLIDQTASPGAVITQRRKEDHNKRKSNRTSLSEEEISIQEEVIVHKENILDRSRSYLSSQPRQCAK